MRITATDNTTNTVTEYDDFLPLGLVVRLNQRQCTLPVNKIIELYQFSFLKSLTVSFLNFRSVVLILDRELNLEEFLDRLISHLI